MVPPPAVRRFAAAVATLAAVFASGACSGPRDVVDSSSGTQRFVAGDGTGTYLRPGSRPPAPVLRGRGIDGKPLDTSSMAGAPLVINVWGSWCAPCRREQPDLVRAARETAALGVRFVGINVRDAGTVAPQRHVERFDVPYPSFHDPGSQLVAQFRDVPPSAIPTTIVVDAAGRVAARVFGPISYEPLVDLVRRVVAEPS